MPSAALLTKPNSDVIGSTAASGQQNKIFKDCRVNLLVHTCSQVFLETTLKQKQSAILSHTWKHTSHDHCVLGCLVTENTEQGREMWPLSSESPGMMSFWIDNISSIHRCTNLNTQYYKQILRVYICRWCCKHWWGQIRKRLRVIALINLSFRCKHW